MYPSYYHSKEIFISDPDVHRMTLPQWSMLNRALTGVWTVDEKAVSSLPLTWLLYIWLLPFVRDKIGLAVSRNLSIQPIQSNDTPEQRGVLLLICDIFLTSLTGGIAPLTRGGGSRGSLRPFQFTRDSIKPII